MLERISKEEKNLETAMNTALNFTTLGDSLSKMSSDPAVRGELLHDALKPFAIVRERGGGKRLLPQCMVIICWTPKSAAKTWSSDICHRRCCNRTR